MYASRGDKMREVFAQSRWRMFTFNLAKRNFGRRSLRVRRESLYVWKNKDKGAPWVRERRMSAGKKAGEEGCKVEK